VHKSIYDCVFLYLRVDSKSLRILLQERQRIINPLLMYLYTSLNRNI